jgi:hypothetical protein
MNDRLSKEHQAVRLLTNLHFPSRRTGTKWTKARKSDHRNSLAWGWHHNILGIGVSQKRTSGSPITDTKCITFYVRRKPALNRLSKNQRIPETLTLRSVEQQLLTDVVRLDSRPVAQVLASDTVRPLSPGAGIALWNGPGPGTLGLLVRQVGSPRILALSCSHVLALCGNSAPKQPIEQPSANGFNSANQVGLLTDVFSTVQGGDSPNTEDIALATVDVDHNSACTDLQIVLNSFRGTNEPDLPTGTPTARNGIGSQFQQGRIHATNVTMHFDDYPVVRSATFKDLVSYETVCAPGDSGAAVWQDQTTQALGIHIGGASTSGLGFFLPIGPIMDNHRLELVT